jgi:hypothetical protein
VSSEPQQSSDYVSLSKADYELILSAVASGTIQLEASNTTIATQSKQLEKSNEIIDRLSLQLQKSNDKMTKLSRTSVLQWLLCGVLGGALLIEVTRDILNK